MSAIPSEATSKNRFEDRPLREWMKAELQRAAGGADEVAENGDVGAVDANAAGIHREAEPFGLFEIDSGVIQFGKAETLRGQNAI